MHLRLAQFLERCFDTAQNAPKPAYALRDAWLRILNTEHVNLHPADREEAEAAIKRLSGT
jgi:hypothetical protein